MDRRLAVVTGASSGIGLELAREFAEHGFALVIASETREIEAAATQLSRDGAEVTAVQVDLATAKGVEELLRSALLVGDIDALAINAGVGVSGEFARGDLDAHLNLVDLNVRGAVHLARLVLPDMIARGEGGILFTSSIAAVMPGPYMSTYNASKSFLLSFAEALRVEVKDAGITVTALMPGPTDTNFFERAGMEDTRLGQSKKDDPREVARDGFEALTAGKDHVVAGSMKNKVQVAAAKVVPDKLAAAAHAPMSKPGSGK
jgi:short-subunit dehydrogenase